MKPEEIWVQPDKVTEDYPGFVVHNGRSWGSITVGPTRLPLWCLIQTMVSAGYEAAVGEHPTLPEHASAKEIGTFLYHLLEQRRELGRLLCVIADVVRREREAQRESRLPWYANPENVSRVRAALHSVLEELDRLERWVDIEWPES